MKISAKFTLAFVFIAIIYGWTVYLAHNSIHETRQNQIGTDSLRFTKETLLEINKEIYSRIVELQVFSEQLSLAEKSSHSNNEFENISNVHDYINQIDKDWIAGKDTPFIRSILMNKLSEELTGHLNFYEKIIKNRVFGEIFLTNKFGVIIASTGRTSDYLQADEQWYQKAVSKDGIYWGDIEYDESSATFSMDLVVSLYDESKNYVGILKGTLVLTDIQKVMQGIQLKSQYKTMKPYLVDKEGFLIFSGIGQSLGKQGKDISLSEFGENISSRESVALALRGQEGYILREENGKHLLTAYTTSKGFKSFKGLGWGLIIDFETNDIFGPIVQLEKKLQLVFFGTLIIAFCIGIFFIRSFLKPLSVLRDGVSKLGEGDFDSKIEIDSKDEVGDLASSFNKMSQKIGKNQTVLIDIQEKLETRVSEQTAYLEKAQEIAHLGNWVLDIENNHLYWSDEVYRIFGCVPQEFIATYETYLNFVHLNDLEFVKRSVNAAMHKGEKYSIDHRIIRPDGTQRIVHEQSELIYNEENIVIKIVGTVLDITDRVEAERTISSYAKELERSNIALGDFAHIASHDLQEPLRKIIIFSDRLNFKFKDMDEAGKEYIHRMQNAATRMQKLINDLLEYSMLGAKEESFSVTDLKQIVFDVLDDLEVQIKSTKGTVNIESLPTLDANPNQMHKVFQNLISNALKYHKNGTPPIINLSSINLDDEGHFEIRVQDNGIGFDEKYTERIFKPFERLHGRSVFEGTGMGLAICEKIVRHHRGYITVESQPQKGSTFIVTLPQQQ